MRSRFPSGQVRFSGDRRGLYSALFYGVSPLAIRQAQNIRMYALVGLLTALSTYFFLRLFRARIVAGARWRR